MLEQFNCPVVIMGLETVPVVTNPEIKKCFLGTSLSIAICKYLSTVDKYDSMYFVCSHLLTNIFFQVE